MDAKTLRKTLRARRSALSPQAQKEAGKALAVCISKQGVFQQSQQVALYLANDGEIDPAGIAEIAWQQGKTCYLPVLDKAKKGHLIFLLYTPDMPMVNNRYGIAEPVVEGGTLRQAQDLDLVLLPLTGFDVTGNRMGMGGGYYDRTFAFTQTDESRPQLVGLAHECQKVAQLTTNPWDISVDAIATDKCYYQRQKSIKPFRPDSV